MVSPQSKGWSNEDIDSRGRCHRKIFWRLLGNAGHEITFIDKNAEVVQAVNETGLKLRKIKTAAPEASPVVKVRATDDGGAIDGCGLIILAVKGYATAAATRSVERLVGPETPILTIQTGLGNIETMAEIVDRRNILGHITFYGATSLDGSEVWHAGIGLTLVGELDGRKTDRVEQIEAAFEAGGLQTEVPDNVIGHIWAKVLI